MRARLHKGRGKMAALCVAGLALAGCATGTSGSSTTVRPTTTASTVASSSTTVPPNIASPYLALWPFRTVADVQEWEGAYSATGSDAWHLDAPTTALDFSMKYLGFTAVDAVLGTTTNGSGAHVSVGFHPTSGSSVTSAVVHLVRWGSGPDAPWEVVGTDDTTFSLTLPAYGATASSPLKTGGTITGVDENIRVEVHQPSSSSAIGSYCCTPAGGTGSPWSAAVSYAGTSDPALTVVAATGGHVQAVERFTVTGVRLGSATSAPPATTTSTAPPSSGLTVDVVANPSHAAVGQVVTFTITLKGPVLTSDETIAFGDGVTTGANAGEVPCQVTHTAMTHTETHQYSAPGTYQFTDEVGAIGPPPRCASIDVTGRATVVVGAA